MDINIQTLSKYSRPGPRYTSYPTAPVFSDSFGSEEYKNLLSRRDRKDIPVSLYFHIPFCDSVCFFCACNVIYTRNRNRAEPYIDLLNKEMKMISNALDPDRKISQLHWGGGTPTWLSLDQIRKFWGDIKSHFNFSDDAEISIELDPRTTTMDHLDVLAECGFNRASLGVQDLDPTVQKAVNRVQPLELSENLVNGLRERKFVGVNIDLIYGLPHQTVEAFKKTLAEVVRLSPNRIALFNFAYLPNLKVHQNRIQKNDLPDSATRLEIFQAATDIFTRAGYVYIGMDHFAKPEDELAVVQKKKILHRNFQGYTTRGECDLIGIGITSISDAAGAYAQNSKTMSQYEEAINSGKFATERGLVLSKEDLLRRHVIMQLICNFELQKESVEKQFNIQFDQYFSKELTELREFEKDGLLELKDKSIEILPAGKFVIRNICMPFDAHLEALTAKKHTFSKTV